MKFSKRERMWAGARAIAPILLGVIPFAIILGAIAVGVGLSQLEGMGMTAIVYAGASQLAAMQMLALNTALPVLVLTVWVINLRFMLYSASLGPYFQELSLGWKLVYSFLITDQSFAVSVVEFETHKEREGKPYFYLGASLALWVTYLASAGLGVVLGAQIPESWQLDFAIPLSFMGLAVPTLKDRPSVFAGLTAGLLATMMVSLPYNLGLPLAVFSGIAVGLLLEKRGAK